MAMTDITHPEVRKLLEDPNYAVVSTIRKDGTPHDTIVWISSEDGNVAVNSAVGRAWPTHLERDPRVTVLVCEQNNPYHYVEIRGRASGTTEGADEHINA